LGTAAQEPKTLKQLTKLGCPADRATALFNVDLPETDTLIVAPIPLFDQREAELEERAPGLSVCY
jgi:hypothetical protein